MDLTTATLALRWHGDINAQKNVTVPRDLAEILKDCSSDAWLGILTSGTAVDLRLLDPLEQTAFAQRVKDSPAARLYSPTQALAAAPPRQDQRSANIQRLTNAYLLLAGKSVKVKLSVEYVVGDDPEEVLLYLPHEAT